MPKPPAMPPATKLLTHPKAPPPPPAAERRPAEARGTAGVAGPNAGDAGPPSRRRSPWRWVAEAADAAVGALGEAAEALAAPLAGRRMHEFADLVSATRAPEVVEAALTRLAGEVSGACRVELVLDRDERTNPNPKLMTVWPESAAGMSAGEVEALGYPLCLGLWCGDHYHMSLQLYAQPRKAKRGWSPRLVRRLTTLCALAAAAERGLHTSQRGRIEAPVGGVAAVRDATFLNAILPYAIAQAARHREPLSVFCLEIDFLAALAREHGAAAVDVAVGRVAVGVARTLRGSDIVARLDDDRVIVVLPNTGGRDALTVANVVRSAIAGACLPYAGLPALTVSIGVACYPIDAQEMLALLHAADEAMERARAAGPSALPLAAAG
jgi:diguanylate cyclase (GGDEF)-like protein